MNQLTHQMVWGVVIVIALWKCISATLNGGPTSDLMFGLSALVVGALTAIWWLAIRRRTNAETDEFKTALEFHLPPEKVFALCLDSLTVLRRYQIQYRNENEGRLVTRLPLTWVSTGETITFQIANGRDGSTSLDIVSDSNIPCPAYDFHSTEKILAYLKNHTQLAD
jgi:hypothetical protein